MARGKSVRLLASIPAKYEPDFMERLDMRTVLGKAVIDRYHALIGDLIPSEHRVVAFGLYRFAVNLGFAAPLPRARPFCTCAARAARRTAR